ncbi:nucleotidyltransferase domain-containing protein [Streptomyces sp. 35G-GA-8]|uniref:nucleotidyltransferase domain-containing protein n=1 Tax=Streptomyces sp. 35G-GA-8 TaxID=2939434 RepID=UPI00201F52B9|nr:nucleotidyltransferase domain-containing protein [Streptomyces sp. 35G-GA-8]MCL7382433.1 nucleotidyltransferase domain-containing protein [Streptomyces sp. 35G-GA-8]
MIDPLEEPQHVPGEVRGYLDELVRRTGAVCGPRLVSVTAVGSLALGDYRHGRSDVDVTVVVDPSLPQEALHDLARSLAHPELSCPAAGLELVVYAADFAARPSGEAGYLLDLNTGALLSPKVSFDATESPTFWYVIDRSVAHQRGLTLFGRPARETIAAPDQPELLTAIRASLREHSYGEGHLADNRVLNGCRSVVYCRTGQWLAKRAAARRIATDEADFGPLLEAAVRSFERPRPEAEPLPAGEVRSFLGWARERVDETARALRPE